MVILTSSLGAGVSSISHLKAIVCHWLSQKTWRILSNQNILPELRVRHFYFFNLPESFYFCEGGSVEVVVEGAEGVVVGHQPQLRTRVAARAVRANVAKDVLVSAIQRFKIWT